MYDRISHSTDIKLGLGTPFSRRQFMAGALAGVGVAVAAPTWLQGAESTPHLSDGSVPGTRTSEGGPIGAGRERRATDIVTLGRAGIKASRLAQGTGFNGSGRSSAHTRLGEKAFDELIRHSLERGIRFIDMADLYGSHPYVRHALQGLPRDKYVLLSKIWPRKDFWNSPSGGAKEEVNRFCKELNTDIIEICLIHCMMDTQWPATFERVRDELSEMKDKGVVKAVGVSCHDLGALKVAAAHPWVDVVLARINNRGTEAAMDAAVEEVTPVLKQARANGKVVLGMKIFGAGKLVTPEEKDASLKYVLQNNLVDAITVGMLNSEQVDDTIERMNKALKA